MKEALFYEKSGEGKVDCTLCGQRCKNISEGRTGFCRVRKNISGKLYSLVYGKAASASVDPIEKKPLFHFAPGSECLSVATVGCNFRCMHCQNAGISQDYGKIEGEDLAPERIVEMAKENGVSGIAYTYTEPTIFYEYALDTMKLARKAGLYNVWVSNGYTSPPAIKHMAKYLDAVNVDIKGNDAFYRKICMAPGIRPVHEALKAYRENDVWVEVTNLVIPGYNDNEKEIASMVKWVAKNLGKDTPLHFSAFFPQHRMEDASPTPPETLDKCYEKAKKSGMDYVYTGNVSSGHESTLCPKCGETVIERKGHSVSSFREKCASCDTKITIEGRKWTQGTDNKFK